MRGIRLLQRSLRRWRRSKEQQGVAYPQSTLEEIVTSERSMFLDGEARYGRHFKHALAATRYLSLCVATEEQDRSDTFGRLFSLMKKHHTLAFLSTLRLHRVQAMLNLRQVLEGGAGALTPLQNRTFEVSRTSTLSGLWTRLKS
jgi:hypothetical protein